MDNLGIRVPATVDQYYNVMQAFKTYDANGNGDPGDEWPMTTMSLEYPNPNVGPWWIDGQLMNPFQTNNLLRNRWIIDDTGKPLPAFDTDGYREGLRWLSKLWQDDLIHPDSFTRNRSQIVAMNDSGNGIARFGAMGGPNWNFIGSPQTHGTSSVVWQYEAMPPLAGPAGRRETQTSALPFVSGPVFTSSDDHARAIAVQYVDWFYSDEGSAISQFGFRDTDPRSSQYSTWYTDPSPHSLGPTGPPATLRLTFPTAGKYFNATTKQPMLSIIPPLWPNKTHEYPEIHPLYHWHYETTTRAYEPYRQSLDRTLPPLYYSADEFEELQRILSSIEPFVSESIIDFVTGRLDIHSDGDWNWYLQGLRQRGLQRAAELHERAYNSVRISYSRGSITRDSTRRPVPQPSVSNVPTFSLPHETSEQISGGLLPSPTSFMVVDLTHLVQLQAEAPTVAQLSDVISGVLDDGDWPTRKYYRLPGRPGVVIATEHQKFDCVSALRSSAPYDSNTPSDGCYRTLLFVVQDASVILDPTLSFEDPVFFRRLSALSTEAPDTVPSSLPIDEGDPVLENGEITIMVFQFSIVDGTINFVAKEETGLSADAHVRGAGLETLIRRAG